jgi:hypothetical protein
MGRSIVSTDSPSPDVDKPSVFGPYSRSTPFGPTKAPPVQPSASSDGSTDSFQPDPTQDFVDPFSLDATLVAYRYMERNVALDESSYVKLNTLMRHFCAPPITQAFLEDALEPSTSSIREWSKFVVHRINLSQICRKLYNKEYRTREQFQVDMHRLFYNCSRYHTEKQNNVNHSYFLALITHCREYFVALWLEHMATPQLPADVSPAAAFAAQLDFKRRDLLRTICWQTIDGVTVSKALCGQFVERLKDLLRLNPESKPSLDALVQKYEGLRRSEVRPNFGVLVDDANAAIQQHPYLGNTIHSILGILSAPVFEFVTSGEDSSCIWATPLAVVWVRYNTTKPCLPATVVSILWSKDDNSDGDGNGGNDAEMKDDDVSCCPAPTHYELAISRINGWRLSPKMRSNLANGYATALDLMKQSKNKRRFMLVEFQGTHELMLVDAAFTAPFVAEDEGPNFEVHEGGITSRKLFKGVGMSGDAYKKAVQCAKKSKSRSS